MALTTLSGAILGQQWTRPFIKQTGSVGGDRWNTLWGNGGNPPAGSFDTTLNGVTLSSTSSQVTGQIPFTNPVSGNSYLARLEARNTTSGIVMLCDRLWHNGGFTITSTGAQSIVSPTWPARDADGATAGNGVFLALEISSAAGAAAPVITISYTNSAGTAGRSAVNLDATGNSPGASAMYRIGLQAGDVGVRSVESLTLDTSWVSGTMNLVAYRPIALLELPYAQGRNAIDIVTSGFPRLYDGSVPYLTYLPTVATTLNLNGQIIWAQG